MPAVVAGQAARRQAACGGGLHADMAALMARLVQAGAELGAGHAVVAQGGLGEECERVRPQELPPACCLLAAAGAGPVGGASPAQQGPCALCRRAQRWPCVPRMDPQPRVPAWHAPSPPSPPISPRTPQELEREEEEEEEVEREVPRIQPCVERDWDYCAALGAASLPDFQAGTGLRLQPLAALARRLAPAAVGSLAWSGAVFATPNFAEAVQLARDDAPNEYLRPVGELLLLPAAGKGSGGGGGSDCADSKAAVQPVVVLLSEREADGLLRVLWSAGGGGSAGSEATKGGGSTPPLLTSLPYLAAAQPPVGAQAGKPAPPLRLAAALRGAATGWRDVGQLAEEVRGGAFMEQLVSMRLFDGQAELVPPEQLQGLSWHEERRVPPLAQLRRLVAGHGGAAEALAAMRGKHPAFARSQLERACDPLRGAEAS